MRSRDSSDRDSSENLSAIKMPSKNNHNVKLRLSKTEQYKNKSSWLGLSLADLQHEIPTEHERVMLGKQLLCTK